MSEQALQPHSLPLVQHKRKFLVVVDDSPECRVALRFASGRASHVEGGAVVLFHVIAPAKFQHWVAVENKMREESLEEATALLEEIATEQFSYCGVRPEYVILEGEPEQELLAYMEKTDDLFALILGASEEGDPGPLVNYFSGPQAGKLKCPVVIVPGGLSNEEIDFLV